MNCTHCVFFEVISATKPHDKAPALCKQSRWGGYVDNPNKPPCGWLAHAATHYQTGYGTLCSLDNDASVRTPTTDNSLVTCPYCRNLLSGSITS
jgi:hypothetical protein